MKKYVPNALTFGRAIVLAPSLSITAHMGLWLLASVIFAIALVTNILDGYLARRWDVCSKQGADIYQPGCDLIFAAIAVWTLIDTNHWSQWIGVLLIVIAGVLQLISYLADKMPGNQMIQRLKRHQSYIHPLYSVAVMVAAWIAFLVIFDALHEPNESGGWEWFVIVLGLLALALNHDHVAELIKKSPAAQFIIFPR